MPRYYRRRRRYRYGGRSFRRRHRRRYRRRNRRITKAATTYIRRCVDLGRIAQPGLGGPIFGSLAFSLTDVPNYQEIQNLYDQFKIVGIQLKFIPFVNVSQINPTSFPVSSDLQVISSHAVRLFTALDFNDVDVPTSVDDIREYSTCKETPLTSTHKRYFVPKAVLEASQGGNDYFFRTNPWINVNNAGKSHYGIKYAFSGIGTGTLAQDVTLYRIEAKYYIKCRYPH